MKLDNICNQVYVVALNEARMQSHEYVTPEHFLYAALMFETGKEMIAGSGGDLSGIQHDLANFFDVHVPRCHTDNPSDSFSFVRMFELATAQAVGSGKGVLVLGNLLAAIFHLPHSFASYIMIRNGVSRMKLLKAIAVGSAAQGEQTGQQTNSEEAGKTAKKTDNMTFLHTYAVDLTQKAAEGALDPLIGRADVLTRTMQVLSRRLKNNPVHVGDPGVGKTAVVEGLAQAIVAEKVPKTLLGAKIYSIDLGLVVAGTKYRGDFEERLIKLMDIIAGLPNPIIYLDEIHTAVGAGAVSGGSLDAASIIKPYLAKGRIKFVGSTTHEEYKKHFEKDRALSRRFQKIDVGEPTLAECVDILQGVKHKYEDFHLVTYSDDVIVTICELAQKYMNDRFMPDKAIDVLDEAGAFLRMKKTDAPKTDSDGALISVTREDIERTVARMAKVPAESITSDENDKLRMLKTLLKAEIFGQDAAVDAAVDAIKASRSGLGDGGKPVASLLFVGPTGVGKTEIAKQLARHLNVKLLRYDMSEYQEKHAVARLIGAPPGYVGYEEGGLLTEAIRKTPHAVLLLDEIEKAHLDIFNVLLQVMDYGALTDTSGKQADFRNVLLIMTSNAGAKEIGRRLIGYGDKTMRTDAIDKAVERIFNPEFRNRLDDIVVFRHVDEDMARRIAVKAIDRLTARLKGKNVRLTLTEKALDYIASKGFSETFGAREIIRVVEKDVKKQLVDEVLFGDLSQGGDACIDYEENEIIIVKT